MTGRSIDPWLLEKLVCPRDGQPLEATDNGLVCDAGHSYRVLHGVPILLAPEAGRLHRDELAALEQLEAEGGPDVAPVPAGVIDPFVQRHILSTGGFLYRSLLGRLAAYPIPAAPPLAHGGVVLDLGCNWGRWCVALARAGSSPIGLDVSAAAVFAARRIAAQLGVTAHFVVGDARAMPLGRGSCDAVFSYSVLQHLSETDVEAALTHVGRVLKPGGQALVEMPHRLGLRALYHQLRRGFRAAHGWDVRYWSLPALRAVFTRTVGPTALEVDGFFSLNPQEADLGLLPRHGRVVVRASAALRRLSTRLTGLLYLADSVYVRSTAPDQNLSE